MIKTIVIDDEKNALDVLKMQLANYCPDVSICQLCIGGQEGIDAIKKHKPDLVLLDIEMPSVNGFDVLHATNDLDYKVIFTTAYNQFAIKAFKYSAVDYLLKPIDIIELQEAISKITTTTDYDLRAMVTKLNQSMSHLTYGKTKIGLPIAGSYEMVDYDDIIRCESDSNYTTIYIKDGRKVVVSKTLKEVEESVNNGNFFRVHSSHLVNLNCIAKVYKSDGGYIVLSNGTQISISRAKRDDFYRIINKI